METNSSSQGHAPQSGLDLLKTRIISYFFSLVLRCINSTVRWEKIGLEIDNRHWSLHDPMTEVFWHSDQLLMPWVYRGKHLANGGREICALVSTHADGRLAAGALEALSVRTIGGSSNSGALRGLLRLKQMLLDDKHVAIAVDGPKGPAHVVKHGAVQLSSHCGVPILPVSVAASSCWTLKSWDKMFIPKPFSRVTMIVGAPYTVGARLRKEEIAEESGKLGEKLDLLKAYAEDRIRARSGATSFSKAA